MNERLLPSQRAGFHYIEHARVMAEGERVSYVIAEGGVTRFWSIPTVNTSALLLGAGTSITQAAARMLADEKVLVAFTGSGGTPIFLGSFSEYAPTAHLQRWISIWPHEDRRLIAAKHLAKVRCDEIERCWPPIGLPHVPLTPIARFREQIETARDVDQLRGYEGLFAKALYQDAAVQVGIHWGGREPRTTDTKDLANRFLDQGNYLAYGIAGVVLWALGVPPGLAVNHGATRAGGLVFDLADCFKDATILPNAFQASKEGLEAVAFRQKTVEDLDRLDVLPKAFDAFQRCLVAAES